MRAAIRRRLMRWYDRNRRDLPWRRREGDLYAQWVAEIMLQQTRVETVRRYYDRFLKRFPSVQTLARARRESVLKHWEGLGYYRRAINLHEGAKRVAKRGRLPQSFDELRELPGIGDYTAGAIASIALGESKPAADGNVARIFARLFAIEVDVTRGAGRREVERLAGALVPQKRPGDFNQALMDLGSLVCTPASPNCGVCPFRPLCEGARRGIAHELPRRSGAKRAVPEVTIATIAIRAGNRVLMQRRDEGGLWSGLWELPNAELSSGTEASGALADLCAKLAGRARGEPLEVAEARHVLTHRRVRFRIFAIDAARGPRSNSRVRRWVTAAELEKLSVSTAQRKVLAALERALEPAVSAPPINRKR